MAKVEPLEVGLVFVAEGSASKSLEYLTSFGLRAGQLAVPPEYDCLEAVEEWKAALASTGATVSAAVCSYEGEDYANIERVHETVGFTVAKYRAERTERTRQIATFAHGLGVTAVSCHIGFIPADKSDPLYAELCDVTRVLCDACAEYGQDFVLETGQESAEVLLGFLGDVARTNLKVNFDPANMVLYGSGDPIAALALLADHVLSIHCKDGLAPAPGLGLGTEVAIGEGAVDFPAFLTQLKKMQYTGLLTIEREESNPEVKAADVRKAIERLKTWKSEVGSNLRGH